MGTPVAADLDLRYQTLIVPGSAGLTLVTYLAEPGSPAAERLVLLASWGSADRDLPGPRDAASGIPGPAGILRKGYSRPVNALPGKSPENCRDSA